ncbi:MAG: oxidoreductase, partial [Pseudomonadota bacterium]
MRPSAFKVPGDIATHAAHLSQSVTGLPLARLGPEFDVLGTPKPPERTVFTMARHAGEIPGTLLVTRQASGDRGGLRLRIQGFKAWSERDLAESERCHVNRFRAPDHVITCGRS